MYGSILTDCLRCQVLRAVAKLKAVRTAPLDYEQDFAARVESKLWDLNREVDTLKGEVKREQEETRNIVLKEMALIQGRMVKTMLDEIRSEPGMIGNRGEKSPVRHHCSLSVSLCLSRASTALPVLWVKLSFICLVARFWVSKPYRAS